MNKDSPIIIGGTGGSGTRVVQSILEKYGIFMGKNLNESKDAMDFEPFLDHSINKLISLKRSLDYQLEDIPEPERQEYPATLAAIAKSYAADIPADAKGWGWKNPRSIYILPLIMAIYPKLYFIHVVRDGRDMAISDNQNQLRKHYGALFNSHTTDNPAMQSIALWSKVNHDIFRLGSWHLGSRYQLVRFEDLCYQPEKTIRTMIGKLGYPEPEVAALKPEISVPETLGRYKKISLEMMNQLSETAHESLTLFNYLVD